MIFYRILDNTLYHVEEVNELGFETSEGLRIPDEYLDSKKFMVMRTAFGVGDWGIISSMPRLLKEKYSDCKVYVPTKKLISKLFGEETDIVNQIFQNNPYVDDFVDSYDGEVFHDHYRIYDKDNKNIPLIKQMLKFWQFEEKDMKDCQPEIYWSEEEIDFGNKIIDEFVGGEEFGCLLISNRFGTQYGNFDKESYDNDFNKLSNFIRENTLPYFYWSYKDLDEIGLVNVNKTLDMKHMSLRIQLYIKSKAKVNISNQCGANHIVARYSDCYEIQRQFPIAHNFIDGETYL